jgi:superfamily II DNA or RNA helicase
MERSRDFDPPISGVYEELITHRMKGQLSQLEKLGWKVVDEQVEEELSAQALTRYLGQVIQRALQNLPRGKQVDAANQIIRSLVHETGFSPDGQLTEGPRQLLGLAEEISPGVHAVHTFPLTPLSDTTLITNSSNDRSLGHELRAELASTDRVDLLCAFIKWYGLRVLEGSLKEAKARQVPIRVLTTTYMGATDRHALDRLVRDFSAEVKVNYEIRSTRLHAKAWLFKRETGFDTGYVGSSNLSKPALLEGLEWNVRLSSVSTPDVLKKFEATFEDYWNDSSFESYDPDLDADRLDAALKKAGASRTPGSEAIDLSGDEVTPYAHQRDMLERLQVAREVHNHHANLLVAATGTGKTVMAALDYRNLVRTYGRKLRLLFVAHRKEILKQSLSTYRSVLKDPSFGELFYGGKRVTEWEQVFASVFSLQGDQLHNLARDHFDVIVIDEFHHATADTYSRILQHFDPKQLLGLTATPERMDGKNVQDEYFDGRIAAEMRLWEALDNDLLCPFHYFGIPDGTNLTHLRWKQGTYSQEDLDNVYTGNIERADVVLRAVADKLSNPMRMRALGFCVTKTHAHFMAAHFRANGFAAVGLDSESTATDREGALKDLREGRLQAIFSVDLFNEGLDIPEVDTILMLRPTNSATVFLQQLGRGLRRTRDKAVLTVLDFIGQHRAEFRFEVQFRALTGFTRRRLIDQMERDFPHMPSGCEIILEEKAKELVISNVRSQLQTDIRALIREVADYKHTDLSRYLADSGREIRDLYKNKNSWTYILRKARLLDSEAPENEEDLLKRVRSFLHVDDLERADAYKSLISENPPKYEELSPTKQAYARMLFYCLWDNGGGFASYQEGLDALAAQPHVREEIRQVLDVAVLQSDHLPHALGPEFGDLPLKVHSSYNRSEILAALKIASLSGQKPRTFAQGVTWSEKFQTDAFLVTQEKDEKEFVPTTRYKDYAVSSTRFHWESQGNTADTSETGQRYVNHVQNGSHVLLFIRQFKYIEGKSQPWMLLGPARYVSHSGSKPIAITWELQHEIPADVMTYCTR